MEQQLVKLSPEELKALQLKNLEIAEYIVDFENYQLVPNNQG